MSETPDTLVPAAAADVEQAAREAVVQTKPQPRSISDIEADMEATRARLTETLGELKTAAQPANLANRQLERVKDFYTDDYGAVRVDRVAKTAGVVVAAIVTVRVLRRIF